jgi:hypothetical protein
VEQLGADLIAKYSAPKDRAQIYYQLCHVYAQSAQARPEKTIAYAKKALEFPLEPVQKLTIYTYWGDAEQIVGGRGKLLPERRKAAAAVYLNGIQEADKLNLPETPPAPPPEPKVNLPPTDPEFLKLMLPYMTEMEAYRKTEGTRELIHHRNVLVGQIAQLYGRKPFATSEIATMSRGALDDPSAERVLTAVRAAVTKASGGHPDPDALAERGAGLSTVTVLLLVVLGIGVVIGILYLVPPVLRRLRVTNKVG